MIRKTDVRPDACTCWPRDDVKTFLESGWDIAEISPEGYKDVSSARDSYKYAARVYGGGAVAVVQRRGRLFLMRKDVDESDRHI